MPEGLIKGIVPAIVTPFRPDERIDYQVWQELIEVQISSGVHGLFVLGGQGEFFALNEEEREVAPGLGEVRGVHGTQHGVGGHAVVEAVDQRHEERLAADPLKQRRRRHVAKLGRRRLRAARV